MAGPAEVFLLAIRTLVGQTISSSVSLRRELRVALWSSCRRVERKGVLFQDLVDNPVTVWVPKETLTESYCRKFFSSLWACFSSIVFFFSIKWFPLCGVEFLLCGVGYLLGFRL